LGLVRYGLVWCGAVYFTNIGRKFTQGLKAMKIVKIKIKGTSPLLINRFTEKSEQPEVMKKATKKEYGTPREQAELSAYKDENDKIWIPTTWITGAIQSIASDYKLIGTRKSVKSVSGGVIIPLEEKAYFCENYKINQIEIDSRPVVVQRARIMRHRARLENWSVELDLQIDEEIIPTDDAHKILCDAGRRSGVGDFRPQKGGPFGKFSIVNWEIQND
jgi:hypothetical protein